MPRAIWYRHWLEIRGGLLVAALIVALMCLAYPIFVFEAARVFARTSGLEGGALEVFAEPLPSLGAERFFPWAAHAWLCGAVAWSIGLFLGGTGIRSNSFEPRHPSVVHTLTLPVSRLDLLWTRFAASCAATLVLLAAMLVVNCAVMLVVGRPVPLGAMAASSALSGLILVVVLAVLGMVMVWDDRFVGFVFPVALLVAIVYGWPAMARFVGSPGVPWNALVVLLPVAAAALAVTAVTAARRDF